MKGKFAIVVIINKNMKKQMTFTINIALCGGAPFCLVQKHATMIYMIWSSNTAETASTNGEMQVRWMIVSDGTHKGFMFISCSHTDKNLGIGPTTEFEDLDDDFR